MRSFGLGARLAFAGAVAIGAALATGELLAGLLPDVPSPLLAVARFIVDIQPPGAKELVVGLFGTADKLAFQVFIVLVALVIGAILGRIASKSPDLAAVIIVAFAAAGFAASLREPAVSAALAAGAAGVEALVGIYVLRRLVVLATAPAAPGRIVARATAGWAAAGERHAARLRQPRRARCPTGAAEPSSRPAARSRSGPCSPGRSGGCSSSSSRRRRRSVRSRHPRSPPTLPPGADLATADLTTEGLTPDRRPERRLLPDRHRVHPADRRPRHVAPARLRARRPRDHPDLRRARRAADHRAVRDDRVRVQRGRRRPRRQREVDRRPAPDGPRHGRRPGERGPARRALRRRLHRRDARRVGHGPVARPDDRGRA